MTLRLGPGIELPDDAVTEPIGILAQRGSGKSNAAVVLAEEMFKAGLPFVAIDPKGDWWGMRSSADGKKPGLPIPIFGGVHGDVPLESGAGAMMAELIVAENLTCILDVSDFESDAAKIRFLVAFGERLFRLHRRAPQPRHVFMEEADEFIPQNPRGVGGDLPRCIGIWTKIVKQGRTHGLGCTIISQRSAVVSKDALTQIGTLIVLRTTGPQDRKAIEGWVVEHAVSKELLSSLSSLEDGEAWIWSPQWLKRTDRVRFRRRSTFDSGATPEVGSARKVATLAEIDLGKVREEMVQVIERAEAEDPAKLRKRIATLERELAKAIAEQPEPTRVEVPVEIPVVPKEFLERIEQHRRSLGEILELASGWKPGDLVERPPAPLVAPAALRPPSPRRTAPSAPTEAPATDGKLSKQPTAMLAELGRRHPLTPTRRQLALWSGYSFTSSTFAPSMAELRDANLVLEEEGKIVLTAAGIDAAGADDVLPATAAELLEMWQSKLPKQAAVMLGAIVEFGTSGATRAEIAETAVGPSGRPYSLTSSTFGESLKTLRKAELIAERSGAFFAIEDLLP